MTGDAWCWRESWRDFGWLPLEDLRETVEAGDEAYVPPWAVDRQYAEVVALHADGTMTRLPAWYCLERNPSPVAWQEAWPVVPPDLQP